MAGDISCCSLPKASAPIPEELIHEEKPGQVVWEERHNRNIATAESQESFMRIPPPLVLLAISQTQDGGDDAIGIIISRTCRNVR
jgi:hypothetical protein